ncbi:peptidoglycan recognition protein family protein [Chitinolyticbacter meiyuanensis]|uniref:peptidoglycan recognition protein family protein n=1 Tax=Chitinolyticbacter meiyuanensis TaxID=682798 RepID=UPI0011E5F50C|nr:peptidoglycan recognition family protein [Chitinolyticbacter meiyuanensis]
MSKPLKESDFETVAVLERVTGQKIVPHKITVNDKAATRQAIILALRRAGFTFKTRSEWGAKPGKAKEDWDYDSIALHHAGNSFSCHADGVEQLKKAEEIDFGKFQQLSYHYAIDCAGTIYEALDVRYKGAHISGGNTGVLGIVMLADFSVHGEAYEQEYKEKSTWEQIKGAAGWIADKADTATDEPTDAQIKALYKLVEVLKTVFFLEVFGGHQEFQRNATGEGRACPGRYGMDLVNMIRKDLNMKIPAK